MRLDVAATTGLLVNGEWQRGSRIPVVDKYRGDPIAEIEVPSAAQVETALTGAAAAARTDLPAGARAAVLRAAAGHLASCRPEIVANYVAETGFTPADGETELNRTLLIFELSAQEAERLTGEVVPIGSLPGHEGSLCFTQRVPVGVVAAVTPFNAPLSTVAHKVAPAIAAGNPVVLKPAEPTPLSSVALVAALVEAGLPDGRIQLLPGPGDTVGDQVVRHPAVRYVSFTGSTAVGRHIRAVCGLARTQLELGSNSPTLLWRDADLDLALPLVARAGYRKAGQVCTSVQRLLVHRDIADEVAERLAYLVESLPYGDPRQTGTAVGPMISEESARRAYGLVDDALSRGGTLRVGGPRAGALMAPTLLTELPEDARLSTEEAFAPVVSMSAVDCLADAVRRANATPFGLQAGVFCQDLDVAFAFASKLDMGGVIINDTSSYHPDSMPYGGTKDSGHGIEGPRYTVHDMTDSRAIVLRLREPTDRGR
jgi:acyl-CoA reductase-like NAD-dependent aldehyde dehydrogenase